MSIFPSKNKREGRKLKTSLGRVSGRTGSRTSARPASNKAVRSGSVKESRFKAWLAQVDWGVFRFRLVAGLFVCLWLTLWARAAQVQLLDGSELAEKARRQQTTAAMVDTPRGSIVDRNGQLLARSVEVRSVYVNPNQVEDLEHTAKVLSEILGKNPDKLRLALEKERSFVWIDRKLSDAVAEQVRAADLAGVHLSREFERIYPFKQVAGQLLGFVGLDGKGLEGIERAYDSQLAGLSMRQVARRDASGRLFHVNGEEQENAESLRLTLDVQVQFMAEEVIAKTVTEVGAQWGGVLVASVESGEVLAWAQYPFFNPNSYRQYKPYEFRNRLALDALEPGSTFKPFLVASALQEGIINKDTVIYCENGLWKTRQITIRDDRRAYKDLTVTKILSLSSNIGVGKIGLSLGANNYHKHLEKLGFGQRTGLQLAESKGILRNPKDWSESDLISASFGQSLAVTVAQMAQAYLVLANNGVYKPLRLTLDDLVEVQGGGQQIFSPQVAKDVLKMMQEVVDDGTGKRAAIEGIKIAGKTGTAQKASSSGAYGRERMASFVGIMPADDPKYLVMIMIDEPKTIKYGGVIGAPVFKEVASRILAYYGDLPDAGSAQNTAQAGRKGRKSLTPTLTTFNGAVKSKKEETVVGEVRRELVTLKPNLQVAETGSVPDVLGQSVRRAVEMLAKEGLVPVIKGEGARVVRQDPAPGHKPAKAECVLWLSEG